MIVREFDLRPDGSATLEALILDPELAHSQEWVRPALLVCPGGAYLNLAHREGEPVAARWLGFGYHAFVVRYRHRYVRRPDPNGEPPLVDEGSHFPEQVVDLMVALRIVREHAEEWRIDSERIYALGFSAGAHVVGSLAERFDDAELLARADASAEQVKPRGIVLCYPMVSARPLCDRSPDGLPPAMAREVESVTRAIFGTAHPTPEQRDAIDLTRHVRADMPRTFVWQTGEDEVVDPVDTLAFVLELQRAHVPCELHLYERGPHGTSLCDDTTATSAAYLLPESADWSDACRRWLALDAPTLG